MPDRAALPVHNFPKGFLQKEQYSQELEGRTESSV